jgi:hypothetical protein
MQVSDIDHPSYTKGEMSVQWKMFRPVPRKALDLDSFRGCRAFLFWYNNIGYNM